MSSSWPDFHNWPYGTSLTAPCNQWWKFRQIIFLIELVFSIEYALIARFMGPTWGPSGADRTLMGPMLAPWTLLSGSSQLYCSLICCGYIIISYWSMWCIYPYFLGLLQWHWGNPHVALKDMGIIELWWITTKHNKARVVCLFLVYYLCAKTNHMMTNLPLHKYRSLVNTKKVS